MTATKLTPNTATIRAFWDVLVAEGEIHEVRIPNPKQPPQGKPRFFGVQSGYFDNANDLINAVGSVRGDDAEAVYVTLNPVKSELLARGNNRLVKSRTGTADADILHLRNLLIDIDAARPSGISATDNEKAAALAMRDAVRDYLGWQPAIVADTGNGGALIYWIDLPNTPANIDLLRRTLASLSQLFDSDEAHVDTGNFNPSRIVKISGTVAAKGDDMLERPWRLSDASFPDGAVVVSRSQLEAVAGPEQPQTTKNGHHEPGGNLEREWSLVELLQTNELPINPRNTSYGMAYDLDRCLTSSDHTDGACFIEMNSGALVYRCQHNSCQGKDWHYLRDQGIVKIPGERQASIVGIGKKKESTDLKEESDPITLADVYAYLPEHKYIFLPTRDLWPAASVNARLGKVGRKNAATWLDQHQTVEQMTWAPGEPMLIEDRLLAHGGWLERDGVTTFNLYLPPEIEPGDATKAGPWIEHVHHVYPTDAEHIINWMAHRVQRPQEKINHALVLGGAPGIGKDTLLDPVRRAVGEQNVEDVTPVQMLGRFNGFVKSVILCISEARDLGEMNRYSFYEHMKLYTAAPPNVLRCDEKNIREYSVLNVCGVVMTTNHKTDGIYLPADDRRHYVCWSEMKANGFEGDYWTGIWNWYRDGGYEHVAAYLSEHDLSDFDAKAAPPKTTAFWDIVDANRAPEDAEMADVLDRLDWPDVVTVRDIIDAAGQSFADWLQDRRNSRQVPYRMEEAGYVAVRNKWQADGRWKVKGKNVVVYARSELSVRERMSTVAQFVEDQRSP